MEHDDSYLGVEFVFLWNAYQTSDVKLAPFTKCLFTSLMAMFLIWRYCHSKTRDVSCVAGVRLECTCVLTKFVNLPNYK